MKSIVIFPNIRNFKDGVHQWGYSFGWLFEDEKGNYCWKFGLAKTREEAESAIKKKHPDVEIVNSEKPIKHRDSNKSMHMTFVQFEELMGKFDRALASRKP